MQAVCFEQHGDPAEVLQVADVPIPEPRRGEVLVRMLASPINPSDVLFVRGAYGLETSFPAIPGFEGVGVVERTGGGVLGTLLIGKRVAVINRGGGNWAEYAVVPARQAIPVPSAMSLDEAATFFVNPATALVITQYVHQLQRGEWLLQSAAASSLGRMIIRLGASEGFRTLNIVRRSMQVEELKSLGADEVLHFDAEHDAPDDLVSQVLEMTYGGVRCAIDPVGGVVGSTLARCLRKHGCLLTYGTLTEDPLIISPRTLIGHRARVEGFLLGRWMDEQSLLTKIHVLRRVSRLICDGVLASDVASRIPLGRVPNTLAGTPHGKALIEISQVTGGVS